MYSGASPFITWYSWMSCLYCILCSTGSQWKFIRTGLIFSDACTGGDFFFNEFPRGHYLVWYVMVKG